MKQPCKLSFYSYVRGGGEANCQGIFYEQNVIPFTSLCVCTADRLDEYEMLATLGALGLMNGVTSSLS